MNTNRAKTFSEIVSVEAWRAVFDKEGRGKVHVDISFFKGSVGAEEEFAVTFLVSLRRAVLRLVIPETEPIAVIQSSVDREATLEGLKKTISESSIARAGRAAINTQLKSPIGVDVTGQASVSGEKSEKTTTEFTQKISEFDIRQFRDKDSCYCWEIAAKNGKELIGKVWDPVKQPRLTVKQTSGSKIPPVLHAQILVRRSDLVIEDVRPKQGASFQNRFLANRTAAAKAIIREKILGSGLIHPDADNDFIEIQIAESIVVEEVQ